MTESAADALSDVPALARPGRMLLWLSTGFFAMAALLCALPHDPYIRYQALSVTIHNRVQWTYERLHFDETPIDVAVIGNSRIGEGVNAPAVSEALSARFGRRVHVSNLSAPQEGRNLHYVIVKELLDAHPEVSLILLSVIEQAPRTGHPAFRDLAEAGDILLSPLLVNRDWPADFAQLPYRQLSLFIRSLAPGVFGMRGEFDPAGYIGPDYDTTQTFTLPDGQVVDRDTIPDEAALRASALSRVRQITPPRLGARFADQEFVVERVYTREIAALAEERGVDVAFLYLPIYLNDAEIRDVGFYEAIGPVLEARQFIKEPTLYSDYGHLNRHGALQMVPWLAEELAGLLEGAE